MRCCAMLVSSTPLDAPDTALYPLIVRSSRTQNLIFPQTFSTNTMASEFAFNPCSLGPSNGWLDEPQRRRSIERHALNRKPISQTNDAIAPNTTTDATMIPNPSTRPSTKQSSVKSRLDGRGPWTSKFELLCRCWLWSNGNAVLLCLHNSLRDQDFWLSLGDSGPMMLSKSSLQTVFERRSWLEGSGLLRYASSVSGVNLAIHVRCGSDVCGVSLDMANDE